MQRIDLKINLLKKLSDNMEIRFHCPVYLVGSMASGHPDPMDADIVMVMNLDRMKRLFGEINFNDRRFRFYKKQKEYYERYIEDLDIDFKVQLIEEFHSEKGPRIRLGSYADEL